MFGLLSDSFVYTKQKAKKTTPVLHLEKEDLQQFIHNSQSVVEPHTDDVDNTNQIDLESETKHNLRRKVSNSLQSLTISKGKVFDTYTEVAFNGKVLRVDVNKDTETKVPKKKRGRPKKIIQEQNFNEDERKDKETAVLKRNGIFSPKRPRGRPRKTYHDEVQTQEPSFINTSTLKNIIEIVDSDNSAKSIIYSAKESNSVINSENNHSKCQFDVTKSPERITLLKSTQKTSSMRKQQYRISHQRFQRRKLNFSQLLVDLKFLNLPSNIWEIHCAFASKNHVSGIYFKCKINNEWRCIKLNNSMRYFLTINGRNVSLMGAPLRVHCLQDIATLADIMHYISVKDPLLLYH